MVEENFELDVKVKIYGQLLPYPGISLSGVICMLRVPLNRQLLADQIGVSPGSVTKDMVQKQIDLCEVPVLYLGGNNEALKEVAEVSKKILSYIFKS